MLTKLFQNKTLSLTSPEVDLDLDYDSLGEGAYAMSLGALPKQFEGDIFSLIALIGGAQAAEDIESFLGEGLSDVMSFLHFKKGQVCLGDMVVFNYESIRLVFEKGSGLTNDAMPVPKKNVCIEVKGGLVFDLDLSQLFDGTGESAANNEAASGTVLNFSGCLRFNVGNLGFAPVSFEPDQQDSSMPSQISIPLPGVQDNLLITLDVKSLSLVPSTNTGSGNQPSASMVIECTGNMLLSGGPKGIQNADNIPHVLPLTLSIKNGLMKLQSSLFIPALDMNLQQLLGVDVNLGSVGLDVGNLAFTLPMNKGADVNGGGNKAKFSAELHWRLPDALNSLLPVIEPFNVYSLDNAQATKFKMRVNLDETGLHSELLSSPFKNFEQGEVFVKTQLRQDRLWWLIKMADFGHVEIMSPIFHSDAASGAMEGSGAFKIIEPVCLPLTDIKSFLDKCGLSFLSALLPDDIGLPHNKKGEKRQRDLNDFGLLPSLMNNVLAKIGIDLEGLMQYLPNRLKHFLTIDMPDEFAFNVCVASNGSCTGAIALPEGQSLKLLLPAGPALYGIELRQLSLGQLNGGKIGLLEVDGSIDMFMLPEIVASMAATVADVPMLPSSKALIMQLEMNKVLAFVHFPSAVVVPVFYDRLELNRIGFEGLELRSQWKLPKPVPSAIDLAPVVGDLVNFVLDKDALLDANSSPFNPPLTFTIGENYLKLPEYFGGPVLGQTSEIASIELWPLIAHALNFTKTGDIEELMLAVPSEYRCNHITMNFFDLAGLEMAWLISSTDELPTLSSPNHGQLRSQDLQAMQTLLPNLNTDSENQMVAMLHGGMSVPGLAIENTIGLLKSNSELGMGFSMKGDIAYLIQLQLMGYISVATEPKANLQLLGRCELALMDQPLMVGEVSYLNDTFTIKGALGLNIEPIQLGIAGTVSGAFSKSGIALTGQSDIRLAGVQLQQGDVSITEKGFLASARLNTLGGGPAFSLKHCALVLASNRNIKVPNISKLDDFALLKQQSSSEAMMRAVNPYLPEDKNQFALAAGVTFSTYYLIESKAIVMMTLGGDIAGHVLGKAHMKLPAKSSSPVINIVMDIEGHVNPKDGVIRVKGGLTNNSYALSKKAKLSGRFAYYAWFSGEHEGDFVVSMGGYHPKFKRPSHYPSVPRLKLNWKLTSKITVKGSMYAALTPMAIMAGGKLEASYKKGNLKAWFNAGANFLIYWQPFYYEADMSVRVGASYKISLGFLGSQTVKTSMGADLEIWGPSFAGKAKVDWSIISFTIRFGSRKSLSKSWMEWSEFKTRYLAQTKDSSFSQLSILRGELLTAEESGQTWHMVDPDKIELQLTSPTPLHSLSLVKSDNHGEVSFKGRDFHLAPMGAESTSNWNMNVKYTGPSGIYFEAQDQSNHYAAAVWGDDAKPKLNDSQRTVELLNRARVVAAPGKPPGFTEAVDADEFKFQDILENDPYWQWGNACDCHWETDDRQNISIIKSTLDQPKQQNTRSAAAALFGISTDSEALDVSSIKQNVTASFIGVPQTSSTSSQAA